jgi:predicted O-methyltransferase YrrM
MKKMHDTFDFIFIDADKKNYLEYYKRSLQLIRKGGVILIDNTLWKGKVMDSSDKTNSTRSIRELNDYIATDKNVSHCLLTLYDGMTLCRKK